MSRLKRPFEWHRGIDLFRVGDIVLQVLQKKPIEATMVVRLEVANDPSIAWLDL
jgi:hypothetical protein